MVREGLTVPGASVPVLSWAVPAVIKEPEP